MFSLTICFGPAATMWTLMYETEEAAKAAFKRLCPSPPMLTSEPTVVDLQRSANLLQGYISAEMCQPADLVIPDDFGQVAQLKFSEIKAVMYEDMELSKMAHIQRALHQARLQAKAQEMAGNDAVLRNAQRGPAIIDPMGGRTPAYNGGFGGR